MSREDVAARAGDPARPVAVRARAAAVVALVVTATGMVVAALRPAWLTEPLQATVTAAGSAAPLVFVALCVLASPLHLTGVLVALSTLVWSVPTAAALSYVGALLGSLATLAALARLGARPARARDGWPAWLERVATRVAHRPMLVGLGVRFVAQTGLAVEAFFLLTGFRRRQIAVVTLVGHALWILQTLFGVAALGALVRISPWLGGLLIVVPLALGVVVPAAVTWSRRRRARA